ncbi:hypothetical protein HPB47_004650 [Ixodes persulcatus]|uniref:Uncharacterized protein n=1 Tax=Ixodes persulcatus TaxID=34615 RepID=A0AC60PF47_IXOPE|nr:hypothetical protein HPB47_004650 [Ixodes persulcatus]
MNSKLLVCVVVLVLSCLVAENQAVTSATEFKKRLLSFNPAEMTPQCRKVFKNCSLKMIGLIGLLDVMKNRWEEYTSVPCVKVMLAHHFPDYSLECSRSGHYGQAVSCLGGPEATAFLDAKHAESLASGIKCLLDNSLP